MTPPKTSDVIKQVRDKIVAMVKADTTLNTLTGGRIYSTDLKALTATEFPTITVQLVKKTPMDGTTGYVKNRMRFKIRGYTKILTTEMEQINDQQIEIGESMSDVFTDNYTLDGICDNSDVADIDYLFLRAVNDESIFLHCVEITLDCYAYIQRER